MLFEIDKEKCLKCGACVKDCAFRVLKTGAEGYPEMPKPERCMQCQHCLAVCPVGAVKLNGHEAAGSCLSRDLPLPKPEEVENWMKVRRSTRQFKAGDVARETIERILKNLGNTPTGCNARGLTFTCLPTRAATDKFRAEFIRAIEEHREGNHLLPRWLAVPAIRMREGRGDQFFRDAPGMLIISSDETNPNVTTPNEDVVAACVYFEMLAQAHGLATCWCGFLKLVQKEVPELLEKTLGLRRTTPFYAMLFGYSAVRYPRGVQREDDATIVWKE